MIVKELHIKNYRLFSSVAISFNETENYLVGKNNVGKTSTIDLLHTLLNGRNFIDADFNDVYKPIEVTMKIILLDSEIGMFGDNFSPDDEHEIQLRFIQASPEDRIEISHLETGSEISLAQVRRANYIGYSSNIKPVQENDLTLNQGGYKLIPLLINSYVKSQGESLNFETDQEDELIDFVNSRLHKIQPFKDNNISVGIDDNYSDYIARSLAIKGNMGTNFSNLGYGLQFSSLIPLKIIDEILAWSRYGNIDKRLVEDNQGEKVLNVILCLDEPEIHLHPNLQLKVMEQIEKMLSGEDSEFNSLLKELFDIDQINGQLFVVTHSPNMIVADYRKICRYSILNGQAVVSSGNNIKFNPKENRALQKQQGNFKNALFTDGVILVEGETEVGAFPEFAKKMGISLVNSNVNIVSAGSFSAIPVLNSVFTSLRIQTVAVMDSDGMKREYGLDNLFFTNEKDFEYECLENMTLKEFNHYLEEFEFYVKGNDYNASFWDNYLGDRFRIRRLESPNVLKLVDKTLDEMDDTRLLSLKAEMKDEILKRLKNKSMLNGELIGHSLNDIPDVYQQVLRRATSEE